MTLLLERASSVLTLAGPSGPRTGPAMSALARLEQASVLVGDDGRIAWIGPADALPRGTVIDRAIDCRGCTLLPALVDAHTHLVWGGDRRDELEQRIAGADYEAILAAGGGILASVRHTRASSEDALYAAARRRIDRMRAMGTTTFEIKSGYGLDLETERRQLRVVARLRQAGVRVRATCLAAHAWPPDAGAREDFLAVVEHEILPAVARERLADFCDVFCDRGAFDVDASRRILERARALGFALRVHANELGPTGGAKLAASLGAASADHLLHVDDDDRRALARAGVVGILLPGTSLVLRKPFADGRALIDAGVAVAVATDCNPGSCAIENLALVLALACHGNRLSPAEAVCAVTHNAAASLDLDDEVGSLVVGRSADLLVLDSDDYRDLVYHAGSTLLRAVIERGQLVSATSIA